MKWLILERFTRCVSRCALFFVSSIFLVSVTLLVIALFVRHPNECLQNPIEGLDVESSALGEKLRKYRQFGESTTWQPKLSKVSTAYSAESSHFHFLAQIIDFSASSLVDAPIVASNQASSSGGSIHHSSLDTIHDKSGGASGKDLSVSPPIEVLPAQAAPSTKQQQRLLDVVACTGMGEGGLIGKNSLPLPFKSVVNDDLLSPQSVWALCQLAEKIEQSSNYAAICRRRPSSNELIASSGDVSSNGEEHLTVDVSKDDNHPTGESASCCPVISIHTFVQIVFPNQDPCQQASKVSLSQTENLRSDIFFCKRTANDPRFANETYHFCVDYRQQINAFLTFLADKNFLKETQTLTLSNIWLPLKEESEAHDRPGDVHDLEVVEHLVEEMQEQNVSSKFQILFQLPANPNVANTQRRRKMHDFANEFFKSIESVALIGIATLSSLLFLIIMSNCSFMRVIGMLFGYFCVFSCSYFVVFVAYGTKPTFVGLLLPSVYVLQILFEVFFNFHSSFADASAASRNDTKTFQHTLQCAMRGSFWSFSHMTLIQTTLGFVLISFAINEITVIKPICTFLPVLSAFTYCFLMLWLPAGSALSFRNKQSVSLPVITDMDSNQDTRVCCLSCEMQCKSAVKSVILAMTPFAQKCLDLLTCLMTRVNMAFCFLPLVIIAGCVALCFYAGVSFEIRNGDSAVVNLFTVPLNAAIINPASFLSSTNNKLHTTFAYEDNKVRYGSLLKDTNRSEDDPFFDCTNAFQRISFIFRMEDDRSKDDEDILFAPETQLWFRRFCNESRHWLQTNGGGNEIGRERVAVHPLRECAVERLLPYFQSRQCQVARVLDGRDMMLDASPCCESYKFPWEPAVYKQCLRSYVIDQLYKNSAEPNIDLRFSKDGTSETGFAVEYDVTFLNYQHGHKHGENKTGGDDNACDLMLSLYEKTSVWFDNQLLSAPYQLRASSNVFVVSPQLTGQNLRMASAKTLLYGLLSGLAVSALGSLLGTLNIINSIFTTIAIFCGSIMAATILFVLKWEIGIYEDVILAVFLVPLVARGPLFAAMSFRRHFYLLRKSSSNLIKAADNFDIAPVLRATLSHAIIVLGQSLLFTSLLTVPIAFETNFLFAARLAQFISVTTGISFFVAIFCLVPLMSRFAFVAKRFGIAADFTTPLLSPSPRHRSHSKGNKNEFLNNVSPPSSASPKSGSTSSGPVSSSSQHSNETASSDDVLANNKTAISQQSVPQTRKYGGGLLGNRSVNLSRKRNQPQFQQEIRKLNTAELYNNGIFNSKSSGHVSKVLEQQPSDVPPGANELIWIPRFPTAGVPLEDFRVLKSPTLSDFSHPVPLPLPKTCCHSNKNNNNMAMSWSAASTSFNSAGVAALQNLEQEFRHIQPPPVLQFQNGFTAIRPPGHSKSFHNMASTLLTTGLASEANTDFLFSPSYHTIAAGDNGNNTAV